MKIDDIEQIVDPESVDDALLVLRYTAPKDIPRATVSALALCAKFGREFPLWAVSNLADACLVYVRADAMTMDEAIGLPPRAVKGARARKAEAKFDAAFGLSCFKAVCLQMAIINPRTGRGFSETEAFEVIAERIGRPATAAKVKRNYKRISGMPEQLTEFELAALAAAVARVAAKK